MKTPRRTAAELIAFHLGWDIADVRDCRYQPTRYASPAIYNMGQDYWAAPSDNRAPKAEVGQPWEEVGEYYGRKVFRSKMETGEPSGEGNLIGEPRGDDPLNGAPPVGGHEPAEDRFAKTRAEFPDFDVSTLPAIPEGFVDQSWHNDQCPSFVNQALGLTICVDYPKAEDREFPESARFGLFADPWGDGMILGTGEERADLYEGDDFDALLKIVEREAALAPTDPDLLLRVTDLASAKKWIDALVRNRLAFHLEDDATDCLGGKVPVGVALLFNANRRVAYQQEWGPRPGMGKDYCPIGYMMSVEPFDPERQAPGCLPGVVESYRVVGIDGTTHFILYDSAHAEDYVYGEPGRFGLFDGEGGHIDQYDTFDDVLAAHPTIKTDFEEGVAAIRERYAHLIQEPSA